MFYLTTHSTHFIYGYMASDICVDPPTFFIGGQWYVCAPPLLTPHFYFPLELYVYITLTNNYLAFFIYQLITLWTISINRHRWLLLTNHISKYNLFILVLYRRYINYVSVCPPHILAPSYATHIVIYISLSLQEDLNIFF